APGGQATTETCRQRQRRPQGHAHLRAAMLLPSQRRHPELGQKTWRFRRAALCLASSGTQTWASRPWSTASWAGRWSAS
ncbi:unnamed protein product, partial [Symbiodinium sp. CCMP2456]